MLWSSDFTEGNQEARSCYLLCVLDCGILKAPLCKALDSVSTDDFRPTVTVGGLYFSLVFTIGLSSP